MNIPTNMAFVRTDFPRYNWVGSESFAMDRQFFPLNDSHILR